MAHSGKLRTWMLSVLLGACAFGCASAPGPVPTKGAAAQPQQVAAQYIIGPGDVLKIVVLRNPELNAEVPVRPDGKISLPLVGDIEAAGKTTAELHDLVELFGVGERNVNPLWAGVNHRFLVYGFCGVRNLAVSLRASFS